MADWRSGYERQGSGYDPGAVGYELQGRDGHPSERKTTMAKKPAARTAKATTTKPRTTTRTTTRKAPERSEADRIRDEGLRNASPNMQSGMDPGPPSDVRERQVRDMFANADELAAPNEEERAKLEERRVQQQIRGF